MEKILDFEILDPWHGLTADRTDPHQGAQSGRWDNILTNDRIENSIVTGNLSAYLGFTIWIWSESPTGSSIALCLLSENPQENRPAYYRHNITIDWSGWRKISVPFASMSEHNNPGGLNRITGVRIASTGYGTKDQNPATLLKFDEMRFVQSFGSVQAEILQAPLEAPILKGEGVRVFDFESVRPFNGLELDDTIFYEGKAAGLWRDMTVRNRVSTRAFPSNVASWDGISFWIHTETPTYAEIAVVLRSDNNSTEGADYFQDSFLLDSEGWRKIYIPFRSMTIQRQPLGLSNISELVFASSGYGIRKPDPNSILRIDDMRLVREADAGTQAGDARTGEIRWGRSMRATASRAVQNDHLVLVYAFSEEAKLARQVSNDVFRDAEVQAVLSGAFECYRFNASVQANLKSWFKITRVPVVMIYTADGDELARFEGAIDRNALLEKARELAGH